MTDLQRQMAAVDSEFTDNLTTQVRTMAVNSGWPSEVAENLTVRVVEGDVALSYTDPDTVESWEYGTGERPPMPVIRKFLNHADELHSPQYSEHVYETLMKALV